MDVGPLDYLVAAAAVLVGSTVQGSIGFGVNLLAAPFVALVVPEALPATLVLVAFPLAVTTVVREHHALDRPLLPWMLIGAVPGTVIGLAIVTAVGISQLAIMVGAITLLGVLLSVTSPPIPVNPATVTGACFVSNVFGTAAAVGGPPVAMLLQHYSGPGARATLGAFFTASAALSLIGYPIVGAMTVDQVLFALALAPAMLTGLWASKHLHPFVDAGWLRPAVLTLSALAGTTAIVRGLT